LTQVCQRLLQRERHLLLRVFRRLRRRAEVCLRPAATLPVMVDRDVPCDLEEPAGQLVLGSNGDGRAADPEKHLLGQIASSLTLACDTAEIPDQAVGVLREE
jgi:hypothetical protein